MGEFVGNEFLIREVCGPSVTGLMGGMERFREETFAGLLGGLLHLRAEADATYFSSSSGLFV